MKIGIIGTFNTGKTSLCHSLVGALKERGIRAEFVPEAVRSCPLPSGTEGRNTLDSQTWILLKQIANEIEAESKNDVIVCDSNVINLYAYFVSVMNRTEKPRQEYIAIAKNILMEWHRTYDMIFKLMIPKDKQTIITNDGFRSINSEWQKEIDRLINKTTDFLGVRPYEIQMDSNVERVNRVLSVMEENKHFKP
jgi:nicotinamide riboside kinase